MDASLPVRRAARLAVVNADGRMLMFQVDDLEIFVDPAKPHDRPYWIMPGGGLEEGESYQQAAARELREETGLTAEVGPCVGTRDRQMLIRGVPTRCLERYFLVRVERAEVDVSGMFGVEVDVFRGHAWWSPGEMRTSGELFIPPGLDGLAALLAGGAVPAAPVALDG